MFYVSGQFFSVCTYSIQQGMADEFCDFMDIDDEYVLQDITSQIVEFRKDKESHYESSLTVCDFLLTRFCN
jgi:hypothetical protein